MWTVFLTELLLIVCLQVANVENMHVHVHRHDDRYRKGKGAEKMLFLLSLLLPPYSELCVPGSV